MACFCLALSAISVRSQPFGGIIAQQGINFGNSSVTCDSFDSSNPAHSIWQTNLFFRGMNYGIWSNTLNYSDSSLPSRTANFHVAEETNYINVGNANIYGYIDTATGGTESVGRQGSVVDLAWVHAGTSGLEPGHFKDDMNQVFTSLSLPTSFTNSVQTNNWLLVATGTAGKTNVINIGGIFYSNKNNAGWLLPVGNGTTATFDYVITNRPEATNNIYYAMDSIGGGNIFVDAPYSVLYLTNGMSSPVISINTNADLFVYSGGDITFGTTINNTALARALTICDIAGHPINITASGDSAAFTKLYVPSSNLIFNGGTTNYDIVTEIFCQNLSINGHFIFHFDESLGITLSPSISSQPTNVIVAVGKNATFAVRAGGSSISYQWFFDQTNPVPDAVNSSLTLTNVQPFDAGDYSVLVTNSAGSVTSQPASLAVFTNAVATLSNASSFANGQFQFSIAGVAGLDYVIQSSSNLVDWVPVVTNVSPFSFADTNAANFSQGFYRAVYLP